MNTTYAIIDAGGEQLRIEPGRFYDICHLGFSATGKFAQGARILLYRVLMIQHQSCVMLGHPWLENVAVQGRILHTLREKKVIVYKMRPKKKMRRKRGHRQNVIRLVVDSIYLNGEKLNT